MSSWGDRMVEPSRGKPLFKIRDVWDAEFGDLVIDKELTRDFSTKHRGSIRISNGLFCTKEEFIAEKKKILSQPLP